MNSPDLEEAVTSLFLNKQAKQLTALPCMITAVYDDLKSCRVDVQPVINVYYKDGTSQEREQIFGVPVVFPSSRTSMVSFPLFVGDTVLCVFASRNIDSFKSSNGQPTTPDDYRKMDAKDAIAIPGLTPFGRSLNNPGVRKWPHITQDLVVAHNIGTASEVELRLTQDGKLVINTELDVVINATTAEINVTDFKVNASNTVWTGNITHVGNYTQTGTSTFNGIPFGTHKHGGVTPGSGVSSVPQP
ncbi:baseplate spike protein [Pseudomonas phage vB_PseuGesM_254]|uniref:Baseplate spike protein n=1 Tax=Pseudomonas phage vB_PseuGesM_254 TaxID=3092638 RepID=A0AAX4G6I7_9CAUD|nr:baseplate spike protein [Pseudomonas phage PseuGes_254]